MGIDPFSARRGVGIQLNDQLTRLGAFLKTEKRVLRLIGAHAVAIGLLSLIVPITVQELVNTFAYAIQPVMVATLATIMLVMLLVIGAYRVVQMRAVATLNLRLFTRVALAMIQRLPRFREQTFSPAYMNFFVETIFLQRSLAAVLMDIINVVVAGVVGMSLLVFYHPYFLLFDIVLLVGFGVTVVMQSKGAIKATARVSDAHYDTLAWLQEISGNLSHFKTTIGTPLLVKKTDDLLKTYAVAWKAWAWIVARQYAGSVIWQAIGNAGLIAMAGWLLATNQIMLGQFVAASVVVGSLLANFDTVTRRVYGLLQFLQALAELDFLFSLPQDTRPVQQTVPLPDPTIHGIRVTCKEVTLAYAGSSPLFEGLNLEVAPGEKVAILSTTSTGKAMLAKVLAGLEAPTSGVIRYNGVDLRDADPESLNACRSLVLDSELSLFGGTLEENITLGRPSISYEDISWALRFVELEEEVDALPLGLQTPVKTTGRLFTTSQILRILVASAIVNRPQLLIFDGTLHSMNPTTREAILRRLCSKEEPWSAIFVSNDPALHPYVDHRLILE